MRCAMSDRVSRLLPLLGGRLGTIGGFSGMNRRVIPDASLTTSQNGFSPPSIGITSPATAVGGFGLDTRSLGDGDLDAGRRSSGTDPPFSRSATDAGEEVLLGASDAGRRATDPTCCCCR